MRFLFIRGFRDKGNDNVFSALIGPFNNEQERNNWLEHCGFKFQNETELYTRVGACNLHINGCHHKGVKSLTAKLVNTVIPNTFRIYPCGS